MFVKLILSGLDFSKGGFARSLLHAGLTATDDVLRLPFIHQPSPNLCLSEESGLRDAAGGH